MLVMLKLKEIKNNAKKYIELCKLIYADPRTPKTARILLWIAIGYALSPIDLIPDFIPVIGHLDDIVIVPILLYIAMRSVPKNVYMEHYVQILRK
ncbi:MAG TPA: YkvA family protein [Methanosarcina sp.]|nr:YkvA family protein [Methanosarcina sp.]